MPNSINPSFTFLIKDSSVIADNTVNNQQYDYSWHHYDLSEANQLSTIEAATTLPHFAYKALMSPETRPRLEAINDGILIILRGINFNDDESHEDMISLRIWIEQGRIVTTQYRNSQTIDELKASLDNALVPATSSIFLAKLVSTIFEKVEHTILSLDDHVDAIESRIANDKDMLRDRERIAEIRKKIVIFKRHLLPQREVISQLRNAKQNWLHDQHHSYHSENYERIMRNLEDLEVMRDRLNIIKEEIAQQLSDHLNRNTYVLSIVAAIFLPLGFLTGLLGINIGGIPGASNPNAFWFFCLLLGILTAIQIWVFRQLKWL